MNLAENHLVTNIFPLVSLDQSCIPYPYLYKSLTSYRSITITARNTPLIYLFVVRILLITFGLK